METNKEHKTKRLTLANQKSVGIPIYLLGI